MPLRNLLLNICVDLLLREQRLIKIVGLPQVLVVEALVSLSYVVINSLLLTKELSHVLIRACWWLQGRYVYF